MLLEVRGTRRQLHYHEDMIYVLDYTRNGATWAETERPELLCGLAGEFRLFGCDRHSFSRRAIDLNKALGLMATRIPADRPHIGPGTPREFPASVEQAAGGTDLYLTISVQESAVTENIACTHDARCRLHVNELAYATIRALLWCLLHWSTLAAGSL